MDNRINEIRRKISVLRSEMTDAEASVRDLVNRDLDCTESALHLLGQRREMKRLVAEWKSAGGGDLLPNIQQVGVRRPAKRENRLLRDASRR